MALIPELDPNSPDYIYKDKVDPNKEYQYDDPIGPPERPPYNSPSDMESPSDDELADQYDYNQPTGGGTGSGDGGGGSDGGTGGNDNDPRGNPDYTDDELTRFNGMPGFPEVWKNTDTGERYIVYFPQGLEPPVPLLFSISTDDEMDSLFGNKDAVFDQELSSEEMMAQGSIVFGEMSTIDRYNDQNQLIRDPWAGFTARMERAKESFPWLEEDPEVFAITAGAYLEGREVEEWEFDGTDYYESHSQTERDAIRLAISDPTAFQTRHATYESLIYDEMAKYGVDPNSQVGAWIAGEMNAGRWDQSKAEAQIQAYFGRGGGQDLDAGFAEFLADSDIIAGDATNNEALVRDLYSEWLGPAFPPDEAAINRWASMMTDDSAGGRDALEAFLRTQRMTLYPNHENENLTYAQIAAPWRSFTQNIWGVPVDETDVEFQRIVQMNDSVAAQSAARQVGSDRGYQAIVDDMKRDLESSMRSGVRGDVF